jgi:hypothetical protein
MQHNIENFEKTPKQAPEKVSETTPEKVLETTPEKVLETTPEKVPETTPEKVPETTPEKVPETTPEKVPETTLEKVPETTLEKVPETTPDTITTLLCNIYKNPESNFETQLLLRNLFDFSMKLVTLDENDSVEKFKNEVKKELESSKYISDRDFTKLYNDKIIEKFGNGIKYKEVIFIDNKKLLLTKYDKFERDHSIIADTYYPNKYLILLSLHNTYSDEFIYGMSVNFKPDGHIEYKSEYIYNTYLFRTQSSITQYIENKMVKLYHDKLVFVARSKDKLYYNISCVMLSPFYRTHPQYDTQLRGRPIINDDVRNIVFEPYETQHKYTIINTQTMKIVNTSISIDVKNTNVYKIEKPETNIDLYPIYFGYITTCGKCLKKTSNANSVEATEYGFKYDYNLWSGMGYGFCQDCMIRYSSSNCKWVCCKPIRKGNTKLTRRCEEILSKDNNFTCTKEHYDDAVVISRSKTFVEPYLDLCNCKYLIID